jgi:hypothetical protein
MGQSPKKVNSTKVPIFGLTFDTIENRLNHDLDRTPRRCRRDFHPPIRGGDGVGSSVRAVLLSRITLGGYEDSMRAANTGRHKKAAEQFFGDEDERDIQKILLRALNKTNRKRRKHARRK